MSGYVHDSKIAVLSGGIGPERDISLQSGANITSAIKQAGFEVVVSDIGPDNLGILDDKTIDVFFLALHGQFGEDGQLQQILEDRSLVFTGSDASSSRLAFDKIAGKCAFRQAGIAVAPDVLVDGTTDVETLSVRLAAMGDKFVVKPIRQGSSVGVKIIEGAGISAGTIAAAAAIECFEQFGNCMVEQFIAGREITVGILIGRALPIIEIRSKAGFYDYHAKYIDEATEYLFETIEDEQLVERISRDAEKCFKVLGCRDLGRVDMMLADDGSAYVLEINTLPGFTSHSLLPMAAAQAGIDCPRLCGSIITAALNRQS